ncbi:helix-turn-helix domain-containing protein [Rudanella lutea]|uniref:helix-turn-helix domain-containing protein n=1 Tax=Rudanella lutea TaxID=451374 RepID=UPI0009FD1CE0|nr:helix-turn-helix domain-containing protein [Rudanella lutea]
MGKLRIIELQPAQRQTLQQAFRTDPSHAFRQRCQIVLFKSEGRTSKEVAQLVKQHYVSVNAWLDRYQQEGLNGLRTKPGRGRKALLTKETDATLVRQVVQNDPFATQAG